MSVALFPTRSPQLNDNALRKALAATPGVPEAHGRNAAILLRSELDLLRRLASGAYSPNGLNDGPIENPMATADRRRAAEDRKAKMLAFDEERRSKGQAQSMEDIEREALRTQQVLVSRRKQDEDLDEVKRLNQVMQYAKCVTVRDAQVLEKRAIAAEKAEEERRQDMAMELERLKALRMYEEREAKRSEDLKKGSAVIRAQIEEREQERLRKIELRQQEQEAMLRHIAVMKEEDVKEAARRRENARHTMEDVALANAEQIRLKARQTEMEEEEDRQIALYNDEKERRDQEVLDERARVRLEKEREAMRLLMAQEKLQDRRSELDALRARRAQEAHEREERAKEAARRDRQAAINEDLARAHEHQRHERELRLAEQARAEKEEFDRIVTAQKAVEEANRAAAAKEAELRAQNALALQKQIAEIDEQRRKERRDKLNEGERYEVERRDRAATVDAIRARKLEELEKLQVPKQYRQELLKKRTAEPLRPSK